MTLCVVLLRVSCVLRWAEAGRDVGSSQHSAATSTTARERRYGNRLKSQTASPQLGSFAYPFAFAADVVLPTTSVSRASVVPPPAV